LISLSVYLQHDSIAKSHIYNRLKETNSAVPSLPGAWNRKSRKNHLHKGKNYRLLFI